MEATRALMRLVDRTPGTLVRFRRQRESAAPASWRTQFSHDMSRDDSAWFMVVIQHRANKFIVRAHLPGLEKEEILVEVWDHELSISGERRADAEHVGRPQRRGRFQRAIPLPEGAKPDTTSATLRKGVLEIEMQAPHWGRSQGRCIEVR